MTSSNFPASIGPRNWRKVRRKATLRGKPHHAAADFDLHHRHDAGRATHSKASNSAVVCASFRSAARHLVTTNADRVLWLTRPTIELTQGPAQLDFRALHKQESWRYLIEHAKAGSGSDAATLIRRRGLPSAVIKHKARVLTQFTIPFPSTLASLNKRCAAPDTCLMIATVRAESAV